MDRTELKIEYVPIDSIKAYKRNAKLHPAEQIEQIKKSIQDYGFRDPVATWKGEIVEGHGRILAAKELGLTEVPVIRLDDMTDEQRREYALVHNQTTMNSGFDFGILDGELAELLDFDSEFYGFVLPNDDEDAEGGGDAENPVDVLPDSRILVTSISAFGTKSEAFIHVPFGKEEAEVLLEKMKNISPDTVGEKIREALNAL